MLCLNPGGLLLLGVPTAQRDNIWFPFQRIYGPYRLAALIEGYELIGRVWNGQVVRNDDGRGHERKAMDQAPPVFTTPPEVMDWQHQQVLVLRKPAAD